MFHEYALDPACVNDWSTFKHLVDQCGFQHGRLISRFPRKWQKEAIAACSVQGVKRTAIVEKLKNMKNRLIDSNREYDADKVWLINAEYQHNWKPFHAIIACDNPSSHEKILIASDIDEETPLWCNPKDRIVPRKADALAACARGLLKVSKNILLIDPHFNPELTRYIETFSYLVDFSFDENSPRRFELHVENKKMSPALDLWRDRCVTKLAPILPLGVQLRITRWQQKDGGDKPHARYILTERGGIRYDYGLDEGEEGDQTTDVSLISEETRGKRWMDYQTQTAAYDLSDEIIIFGIKEAG
jgi:hypothetical protein